MVAESRIRGLQRRRSKRAMRMRAEMHRQALMIIDRPPVPLGAGRGQGWFFPRMISQRSHRAGHARGLRARDAAQATSLRL